MNTIKYRFPKHGWLGLFLIAVFWTLNWSLDGLRTHILFFPLWLGYALAIDGLVVKRKGTSLVTRSWKKYMLLFVISIPAWWLFELINVQTQNWVYLGKEQFPDWQYALLSSLSFSTVIPAVFGASELIGSFDWLRRLGKGPAYGRTAGEVFSVFVLGWVSLAALLLWPRYFFPFVWMSVFFILDPVNVWLGKRALIDHVKHGDWRPVLALWMGCLMTGFFWELWNFYSYPKWIYQVPFVDFLHVFEMPLIGFLGYLPFAMELFAIYHLLMPKSDSFVLPDFVKQ